MNTAPLLSGWRNRSHVLLGLLRLITAFLFIQYGTMKWFAFPGPLPPGAGDFPVLSQMGIAGLLEIVGGALLFVGLFTRPTAFILAGEMAFAYFIGHASQGFWPVLNQGTPAVLFCFVFLYFSAAGPGAFALSNAMARWNVRRAGFTAGNQTLRHSH